MKKELQKLKTCLFGFIGKKGRGREIGMRIIRKGIGNWKEKERKKIVGKKKCPRCKCKFEFEYEDTYKALSIIRVENYYVDCPHCGKVIYLCHTGE